MTFQQKTMILRILEYFIEQADDDEAKEIMKDTHEKAAGYVDDIKRIFREEGAVIPIGYTEEDVHPGVPKLYDNGFDIMFLRLLKEISMGMHTLHLNLSFRKDIVMLYKELTGFTQSVYDQCVDYLQKHALLPASPPVTMPKKVEFAESPRYMKGFNVFSSKRTLNTIEVGYIHFSIESNSIGMRMITGFSQVANEPEVRKYFQKGKDLAKKIIDDYSEQLLNSDIQPQLPSGGNVTTSKTAPFSDKLMMYCTSLFCSFALGNNAIGTAFSMRSDLPFTLMGTAKDILTYSHEGGKLMAKNGWMEEPPQMEDRNNLVK